MTRGLGDKHKAKKQRKGEERASSSSLFCVGQKARPRKKKHRQDRKQGKKYKAKNKRKKNVNQKETERRLHTKKTTSWRIFFDI